MYAMNIKLAQTRELQLSFAWMIILHLLPGALAVMLMLIAGALFQAVGLPPSVPVLFVFVSPVLILMQLGFLYHTGKQMNGKFSLKGVVLYRDEPMIWWKLIPLALPILAWIALV